MRAAGPAASVPIASFLALALLAATTVPAAEAEKPPAPDAIQPEEYAVYRVALSRWLQGGRAKLVVIRQDTRWSKRERKLFEKDDQKFVPAEESYKAAMTLPRDLREDFVLKNTKFPAKLGWDLDLDVDYTFATAEQLASIFGHPSERGETVDDQWNRFYAKYPESRGLLTVSRVGFNKAGDQALVEIGSHSGALAAGGTLLLLAKEKGAWVVKKRFWLWAS
ncbi:MAG TPA: hypothetical protein PLE19_07820 [Planctomycetota bacterium]|nr:hypothetical protein [Planctomycetota bacterium]HRR78909.1 hypothetical protein [Planctomycetota bacterium]HRT92813.1 hypothetical protein [Planctomycetota bacterium]